MSKLSQAIIQRHQKKEEKKWYNLNQEDILDKLKVSKTGLGQKEVIERREEYGPNKLAEAKRKIDNKKLPGRI